jgi:glycosyltransferase involved in cell wall biosynthesis
MRVCIVTRSAPVHAIGGMEDHTRDLATGLAAAGHEVDVFTSRHPDGVEEETSAGVRWRYLDAPGNDFASTEWRTRSADAFAAVDRERSYDVVHSEGSSGLELARRGVQRQTPFVVEFHGNFVGLVKASLKRQARDRRLGTILREQRGLAHLSRRHFAAGNWRVFRDCEVIVPSHQQVADTRIAHLLVRRRMHVVPNGVDARSFQPRSREELRARHGLPAGLLFVCAGRLVNEKGTHHAICALSQLPGDARLLIVGDGAERPRLEELARSLGVDDRVVFAGRQPSQLMPDYLGACDVFLFPTEREEAAPLVLPQAMACGLAVIASDRGGIGEVIRGAREAGILVRPGDVGELTRAMQRLAGDENERGELGRRARARVEEEYTLERMIERTVAVYEVAKRAG